MLPAVIRTAGPLAVRGFKYLPNLRKAIAAGKLVPNWQKIWSATKTAANVGMWGSLAYDLYDSMFGENDPDSPSSTGDTEMDEANAALRRLSQTEAFNSVTRAHSRGVSWTIARQSAGLYPLYSRMLERVFGLIEMTYGEYTADAIARMMNPMYAAEIRNARSRVVNYDEIGLHAACALANNAWSDGARENARMVMYTAFCLVDNVRDEDESTEGFEIRRSTNALNVARVVKAYRRGNPFSAQQDPSLYETLKNSVVTLAANGLEFIPNVEGVVDLAEETAETATHIAEATLADPNVAISVFDIAYPYTSRDED